MATTTHNLKIKAVLDTSEIRSQLNGIRESNAVGSGINSSLDLNNAITRLVQALDKLPNRIEKTQKQSSGPEFNARAFGSFAMAYGFGRVGQVATRLQEASGFEAPGWQNSFKNIGESALAGAAFGPAGAAIGAGLGLVQSALEHWAESLRKSVEELDEWNRSVKEAAQFRQRRKEYSESKLLESALNFQKRTGDTSKLLSIRDELNEKAERLRKLLQQQDKNAASGLVASNAMQIQSDLEKTEASIRSINSTLEQIDKADKAELERKRQKELQEELIREREEKARQQQVASMNELFLSRLDAFNASKEDERITSVIDKGDFREIAAEKKKQQDIAYQNEILFKQNSAIGMAEEDPTMKSEFLKKTAKAQEDMNYANSRSKALESAQKPFIGIIKSELKSREDALKGPLDTSINDFSSDYKAGLGLGEVGYDVSQEKTDKVIDIATVIKDVLEDMRNEQKTQTEVTRQLKNQGLL